MNNYTKNLLILILFTIILAVSTGIIITRDEPESIETMNTAEDTSQAVDTLKDIESVSDEEEASAEEESRSPIFDGGIALATAPILGGNEEETQVPDYEIEEEPPREETDNDTAPVTTAVQTTRTIITSRERKQYDSNSVYIDMENILQQPELPVGCEITALTTLLRYYGFDAEKTDMARNYLPTSWGNAVEKDGKMYKDSFFDYFIGDPFSRGYGCFSPAIEKAANAYISDHGGGFTVKNISGCHPDTLYEYLIKDIPVLCWATDGMIEPEYYETWYDNATGEQLDWYLNEHCFVLTGFNISGNTVTLNDPMKGIIDYNIDRFEVRFKQMYSQAIVIIPEGGETTTETAAPVTEDTQTDTKTAADTAYESTAQASGEETDSGTDSEISSDTEVGTDTEIFSEETSEACPTESAEAVSDTETETSVQDTDAPLSSEITDENGLSSPW